MTTDTATYFYKHKGQWYKLTTSSFVDFGTNKPVIKFTNGIGQIIIGDRSDLGDVEISRGKIWFYDAVNSEEMTAIALQAKLTEVN